MRNLVLTLFLTLALLFTAACEKSVDVNNIDAGVVKTGTNVYYFPYARSNFALALSTFIEKHPELQLIALTADDTDSNGVTKGYFAVFQPKQISSVEECK